MAVRLRLLRAGTKKKPFYQIVAMDQRKPRNSVYLDKIGYYDPTKQPSLVNLDEELAIKHLKTGAQPSTKVRSLLSKAGILKKLHEEKYGARNNEAK
ncbi:MAG: 30S ribosomal protein S16 [Candidatus Wallbacteria bacterium HGW-Wallbacteria-1]|jgi:small subunit ribosomal protein S16|uniref:Small ribosomal subunit protein bS16 n=1 Tax=Candidatus Wallbacteria bacterium HGW-Wallbacteria-1 TaxID=2013854 RepID=A0A2N1PRT1_9BACT|nr:MAG: 30S ribosomal protein S16 [Candidatus Wallbacteria bacterium HGW-Wallbacteria-1]